MAAPSVAPGTAGTVPVSLPESFHVNNQDGKPMLERFTRLLQPVSGPLASTFESFHNWKENMGLVQPGTVENLTRDVTRELEWGR